jgi:hypothetical protein
VRVDRDEAGRLDGNDPVLRGGLVDETAYRHGAALVARSLLDAVGKRLVDDRDLGTRDGRPCRVFHLADDFRHRGLRVARGSDDERENGGGISDVFHV